MSSQVDPEYGVVAGVRVVAQGEPVPKGDNVYRVDKSYMVGGDLDRQSEQDLLWIREPFLASAVDFGKIIVHGHTPTPKPEVLPNRINIDTGAFATGRLICVARDR